MTDDRLPTELLITAHIRQCASLNIPVYVLRKGAFAAGTVMVKIVLKGGRCRMLNQSRNLDGTLKWMDVFDEPETDEKKADDYIRRSIARDPDVWAIEVEDPEGRNPFELS